MKFAANKELMDQERKNTNFIYSRAEFLLPEIYLTYTGESANIIAMEYFYGCNAGDKKFLKTSKEVKKAFWLQC